MATPSSVARRSLRKAGSGNGKSQPSDDGQGLDVRELLRALQSVRDGDFRVRMPTDLTGLAGKVSDTFNQIVASNELGCLYAGGPLVSRRSLIMTAAQASTTSRNYF